MTNGEIEVVAGAVQLSGLLQNPDGAHGLVVFVHGSGSSRLSARNRAVAKALVDGGLATLLFDLLTPEEETLDMATGELRFDIDFLARRLLQVVEWIDEQPALARLALGFFGSSTGAAAALVAAAEPGSHVQAVVSRGGRPDLAGDALRTVKAPTLLIVGGRDLQVLELNRDSLESLMCEKSLEIVPGATHLFEEPGTLSQVAILARNWFTRHLSKAGPCRVDASASSS